MVADYRAALSGDQDNDPNVADGDMELHVAGATDADGNSAGPSQPA